MSAKSKVIIVSSSALISCFCCLLWALSYFHITYFFGNRVRLSLGSGVIRWSQSYVQSQDQPHLLVVGFTNLATEWVPQGVAQIRCYPGVKCALLRIFDSHWSVVIPLWAPTLLFALPLISIVPILRRRWRLKKHLCPKCGYDQRGSGNRCPECGCPTSEMHRTLSPAAFACAYRVVRAAT